jgi:hypothetical protein
MDARRDVAQGRKNNMLHQKVGSRGDGIFACCSCNVVVASGSLLTPEIQGRCFALMFAAWELLK